MSSGPSRAPAVVRAAAILQLLSQTPGSLSLTQIANSIGAAKSSALTLCSALEDAQLVFRDAHGAYELGPQTVHLGAAYIRRFNVVREFYRWAQNSPILTGELLQIGVLQGRNVFYLGRYEGRAPLWLSANIGDEFPASITAVGKALLSELSDNEIRRLYRTQNSFELWTPHSAQNIQSLLEQVRLCRSEGFARDNRGTNLGVYGIAVPVENFSTHAQHYAIGVSIPYTDYSEERVEALAKELELMREHLQNPNHLSAAHLSRQNQ